MDWRSMAWLLELLMEKFYNSVCMIASPPSRSSFFTFCRGRALGFSWRYSSMVLAPQKNVGPIDVRTIGLMKPESRDVAGLIGIDSFDPCLSEQADQRRPVNITVNMDPGPELLEISLSGIAHY
jgi:hypothetical protein